MFVMPVTRLVHFLVKYWKFYELWNFAAVFSFRTTFDGQRIYGQPENKFLCVFSSLLGTVIIMFWTTVMMPYFAKYLCGFRPMNFTSHTTQQFGIPVGFTNTH